MTGSISTRRVAALGALAAITLAVLAGCGGTVPVAQVTSNPQTYLETNFGGQTVRPQVAKVVPASTGPRVVFSEFKITLEGVSENNLGRKDSWKSIQRFYPAALGQYRKIHEFLVNDIPDYMSMALSYKGVNDLQSQNIPVKQTNTAMILEIKEVTRFDALPPAPGEEATMDANFGNKSQVAGYWQARRVCKNASTQAASLLNPRLQGASITLACEDFNGSTLRRRTQWAFLVDYDLAILLENISSDSKISYRVTDVSVRN